MDDPYKGELVTPCINIYKAIIQSDGSIDKFRLRILLRVYFQNKEKIENTWSPTEPMRPLNYFLEDTPK